MWCDCLLMYWSHEQSKASTLKSHDGGSMLKATVKKALARGQLHDPTISQADSEVRSRLLDPFVAAAPLCGIWRWCMCIPGGCAAVRLLGI